jgi:hypothetical protein
MNAFVIRCYRAQAHVGKVVRSAIRHHWNVGHTTAHAIYGGLVITCVAVPLVTAGVLARPLVTAAGVHPDVAPLMVLIPEPSALPVFVVGFA